MKQGNHLLGLVESVKTERHQKAQEIVLKVKVAHATHSRFPFAHMEGRC
jgi:hypothetical protein